MFFPQGLKVLAIGSHPDDIELGAGGFISRLGRECHADVHFLVLTRGLAHPRRGEQFDENMRRREALATAAALGIFRAARERKTGTLVAQGRRVTVLTYNDTKLRDYEHDLIKDIEEALRLRSYGLILTHSKEDTHSDHQGERI